MAFIAKNIGKPAPGRPSLTQWIHVSRAAAVLPQTTTDILFRVFGGRVLVHLFLGQVTTVMTATDPVLKISSKALDGTPAAVGSAVDVAATTSLASKEVGASAQVLGSGAALVVNNAGAGIATLGRISWIAPQGEIYATTGGSNTTGQMKFDLWYQPLDEGAYVVASATATVI